MRPTARLAGLVAALLTLCVVPSASAMIYWTSPSDIVRDDNIGRANLDGTGADPLYVHPLEGIRESFAIGGGQIYWPSTDISGFISRVGVDSFGAKLKWKSRGLEDAGGDIAVSGDHVYWSNPDGAQANTISRMRLDGSGLEASWYVVPDIEGERQEIDALTADSTHVWFHYGSALGPIARVPIAGGAHESVITFPHLEFNYVSELAVDDAFVYWFDPGVQWIRRAPKTGHEAETAPLIDMKGESVDGLAVQGDHLYFGSGDVGRAKIDGTEVDLVYVDTDLGGVSHWGGAMDVWVDSVPSATPVASGLAIAKKARLARKGLADVLIPFTCRKNAAARCSGGARLTATINGTRTLIGYTDYDISRKRTIPIGAELSKEAMAAIASKGKLVVTVSGSRILPKKVTIRR